MLGRIQTSVARERAFVSDASHELRTPLTMLRTELDLIARDRPTGAALQTATGSAIEETDRLTRLADDLLLLARADHGRLPLRRASVGAAELLGQAGERARHGASEAGVDVTVDASPELHVDVDAERVLQALDNLVANALRHARGRVALIARADGERVELHVTDDGPGFPAQFLPQAFERFARADAGRTDDGAGLGLAIVRTIAEAHGATAHAANRPQGGADVWIAVARA
jgi:signal transduction histidine kinase